MIRSADILEGKIDDTIQIFNEQLGKMEKDIEDRSGKQEEYQNRELP